MRIAPKQTDSDKENVSQEKVGGKENTEKQPLKSSKPSEENQSNSTWWKPKDVSYDDFYVDPSPPKTTSMKIEEVVSEPVP